MYQEGELIWRTTFRIACTVDGQNLAIYMELSECTLYLTDSLSNFHGRGSLLVLVDAQIEKALDCDVLHHVDKKILPL